MYVLYGEISNPISKVRNLIKTDRAKTTGYLGTVRKKCDVVPPVIGTEDYLLSGKLQIRFACYVTYASSNRIELPSKEDVQAGVGMTVDVPLGNQILGWIGYLQNLELASLLALVASL